jgi:hypothetical protein
VITSTWVVTLPSHRGQSTIDAIAAKQEWPIQRKQYPARSQNQHKPEFKSMCNCAQILGAQFAPYDP